MKGRLDKIISTCLLVSRSDASQMIKKGRVTVDGEQAKNGKDKIDTEKQAVAVDGKPVSGQEFIYLMMNKPAGVISATEDKKLHTVLDLLPDRYKKAGLGVVGRLDRDAEGLLLLTNNGELNHRLTSPRSHVDKLYLARLDAPAAEEDKAAFASGMDLGDFTAMPAELVICGDGRECMVTVREGKFHQVKRMFSKTGNNVQYLKRLAIGPLKLDNSLRPGDFRELGQREIEEIFITAGIV